MIITTGAAYRKLGIPGEDEYSGHGVSYCATCDGFFFRDKDIVVVGGGDTAIEEAIFLTRFGKSVDVVHRRDELRASKIMQQRAFDNPKISFTWDTVLEEAVGNRRQARPSCGCSNVKTGEETPRDVGGLFIAIGHDPATKIFEGQIDLDEAGYIKVEHERLPHVGRRASSPAATASTTSTVRRSPPPAWAAWRRSTPNAGSKRRRIEDARR